MPADAANSPTPQSFGNRAFVRYGFSSSLIAHTEGSLLPGSRLTGMFTDGRSVDSRS